MIGINVKVTNGDIFKNMLNLSASIKEDVKKILENVADIGVEKVKSFTPVKTGNLKNAVTRTEVEEQEKGMSIGIGDEEILDAATLRTTSGKGKPSYTINYWKLVEEGTDPSFEYSFIPAEGMGRSGEGFMKKTIDSVGKHPGIKAHLMFEKTYIYLTQFVPTIIAGQLSLSVDKKVQNVLFGSLRK